MSRFTTNHCAFANTGAPWGLVLMIVMLSAGGCGGDTLGRLQVTIHLESASGISRACADLGADTLELSFFAETGDVVPHDIATVDCEATPTGWATFALAVTAQTYTRVVLRFVTSTGTTVRVCDDTGRVDAVLEQTDVKVEAGVLGSLDFVLVGDSQPCSE